MRGAPPACRRALGADVDRDTYGVIFDMDGVLADTAPQHFQSWLAIEPHLGVRVSYDDFRLAFGRPNHEGIRILLHRQVTPEEVKEIDRLKEAAFREIARESLKPLPGVVRLIKELDAGGFRLAVGSSGPRENIEMVLRTLGAAAYFGAVVSGWDVTRGKPDPEVFLKAAAGISVDPHCCLVFEDVPVGIEAAHAAGMKCIAVTTTRPAEDLRSADRVVESLDEVTAADVATMLGMCSAQPRPPRP